MFTCLHTFIIVCIQYMLFVYVCGFVLMYVMYTCLHTLLVVCIQYMLHCCGPLLAFKIVEYTCEMIVVSSLGVHSFTTT